jgi:hypothetical protein
MFAKDKARGCNINDNESTKKLAVVYHLIRFMYIQYRTVTSHAHRVHAGCRAFACEPARPLAQYSIPGMQAVVSDAEDLVPGLFCMYQNAGTFQTGAREIHPDNSGVTE